MNLKPKHLPMVTMLTGLGALVGLGIYQKVARDSASFTAIPIVMIVLGVSLAIVQYRTGFALQRGGRLVSRVEDPFFYWLALICSTVPFIAIGIFLPWVD